MALRLLEKNKNNLLTVNRFVNRSGNKKWVKNFGKIAVRPINSLGNGLKKLIGLEYINQAKNLSTNLSSVVYTPLLFMNDLSTNLSSVVYTPFKEIFTLPLNNNLLFNGHFIIYNIYLSTSVNRFVNRYELIGLNSTPSIHTLCYLMGGGEEVI